MIRANPDGVTFFNLVVRGGRLAIRAKEAES
jgi:hypothetical protein